VEQQPHHVIDLHGNMPKDWPIGLKSVEEAAQALAIDPARLIGLADGGFAPHYRVDGGGPLFRISELKAWAAQNMLQRWIGRGIPEPVVLVAPRVLDFSKVPECLRMIANLCDVSEFPRSGIYFLCHEGRLLYVGKSVNVSARIISHREHHQFDRAFFLPWPSDDLDRIEQAFIRHLVPPLNGKIYKRPSELDTAVVALMRGK
jgi:hypothetical protein